MGYDVRIAMPKYQQIDADMRYGIFRWIWEEGRQLV